MKRFFYLFLFFNVFSINLIAQIVTPSEAQKVANVFFKALDLSETNKTSILVYTGTCKNNLPTWYLLTSENKDFIIVSADRRAFPIIGYGFNTKITSEKSHFPPSFNFWMNERTREIEYIRDHNLQPDNNIYDAWEKLLNGTYDFSKFKSRNVAPLLVSTWNQDCWYNEMCPVDPAGPCGHVYAGCVATAMGQVMYYWRYPLSGQGSKTYNAYPYGTLTANFGSTTYKWHEMIGNINNSHLELARLLFHCGVAVEMLYGPQGSSSNTLIIPDAMKNYFRYATANYRVRHLYSDAIWISMLKNNIDNKQPVIYSGSGPQGGHAFICDGYQDNNYFHFDWGWSGMFNGYYHINNLNPGGNLFNTMQAAVMDIHPPSTGYPYSCGQINLTSISGSFDDGSGPKFNYQPNSNCSWLIKPNIPVDYIRLMFVYFQLDEGDTIRIYGGETTSAPLLATYTSSSNPQQIQSNTQAILVTFTTDNIKESNGFLAEYSAMPTKFCSSTITITNYFGIIEDGSGAYPYAPNSNCRWDLQPPHATKFTITFLEFNTEPINDKVRILDLTNNQVVAEFSGNIIPSPLTVNTNRLRIHFISNASHQGEGWKLQYNITTGIQENNLPSLNIYPNPAFDILIIDNLQQEANILITDLKGKILKNMIINPDKSFLDVSDLPQGVFIAKIITGYYCLTFKFIKK